MQFRINAKYGAYKINAKYGAYKINAKYGAYKINAKYGAYKINAKYRAYKKKLLQIPSFSRQGHLGQICYDKYWRKRFAEQFK